MGVLTVLSENPEFFTMMLFDRVGTAYSLAITKQVNVNEARFTHQYRKKRCR